jgi:hypothetical protein
MTVATLSRRPNTSEARNPFAMSSRRFEGAIEHVWNDGGRLTLAQMARRAMPSRTSFERLQPHQLLDPMQTA